MVKFNRILTLLGVSALCSFVAGYPSEYEDGYDGECKEFNDFIVEHKGNINYCEMESGQIIEIGLNVETLNQAIVDKLGTHPIDIVYVLNFIVLFFILYIYLLFYYYRKYNIINISRMYFIIYKNINILKILYKN